MILESHFGDSLEINEYCRGHEESYQTNGVTHEIDMGENLSNIFYILYDKQFYKPRSDLPREIQSHQNHS